MARARIGAWFSRHRSAVGILSAVLMVAAVIAAGVGTANTAAIGNAGLPEPGAVSASPSPVPPKSTAAKWVQKGPWRVPPLIVPTRSPAAMWPHAYVTVPLVTPDHEAANVEAVIDATHLLVVDSGVNPSIYSYHTVARTFTLLVTHAPWADGTQIATSAHWFAWLVPGIPAAGATIYRAPLSGGVPQNVATLTPSELATRSDAEPGKIGNWLQWYMTDTAIYWSGSRPGIVRIPLTGGQPAALPGFGDFFVTDDSPWMSSVIGLINGLTTPRPDLTTVTTELKNVDTGADIQVAVPPHTRSLGCTPTVCIGFHGDWTAFRGTDQEFLQRPDGTAYTAIQTAVASSPFEVLEAGATGSLVVGMTDIGSDPTLRAWEFFYDPVSGGYLFLNTYYTSVNGMIVWATPGNKGTSALILNRMD